MDISNIVKLSNFISTCFAVVCTLMIIYGFHKNKISDGVAIKLLNYMIVISGINIITSGYQVIIASHGGYLGSLLMVLLHGILVSYAVMTKAFFIPKKSR